MSWHDKSIYNTTYSPVTISTSTITGSQLNSGFTWASGSGYPTHPNKFVLYDKNNSEILTITNDGAVEWANKINIDEAAEALESSITLSTEHKAGIKNALKNRIRDEVFESMIEIAGEKGFLTVDELTYMHASCKIMDKLKGIE